MEVPEGRLRVSSLSYHDSLSGKQMMLIGLSELMEPSQSATATSREKLNGP